jgi:hypothetical protein
VVNVVYEMEFLEYLEELLIHQLKIDEELVN